MPGSAFCVSRQATCAIIPTQWLRKCEPKLPRVPEKT
jgi:hypothetical protein